MESNKTTLERAFELASSGCYAQVEDIRRQLKLEGYSEEQLYGGTLIKQLRNIIRQKRAEVVAPESAANGGTKS